MTIENQKVQESKTTCPKGVFTEEEFLKMVRVVDRERKTRSRSK
jgi:hypothetical protein